MKNMVKFLIHVTFLVCLSSNHFLFISSAKIHKHRKVGNAYGGGRVSENDADGSSATFNVLNYGAKGDGIADDTSAFEAAWKDACQEQGSVMLVPTGSVFLVKPISFSGPNCMSGIVFQLDGKIIAPRSSGAWGSGLLQWLEFTKLTGITIRGKGSIDGQGSVWWNDYSTANPTDDEADTAASPDWTSAEAKGGMPSTRPTALRFYGSTDVTVTGITIQNSPQTHLKFDDCIGVQVFGISVSSPGDSPNTDGIHLQNSQDVVIHTASLACGDDCISIQTGCSGVYVHNVNCGPGHGISIGGLGKDGTKACVSNITVRDSTIQNTLNGVRIKTWQGGSGSVQGVMFSNIQVSEVETPIIIDQFYCNGHTCPNKTSAVAVSGVSYQSIKGTYTVNPVHFACSDSTPCAGITLSSIVLSPLAEAKNDNPFCWKAFGELQTATTPPISCLQTGDGTTNDAEVDGEIVAPFRKSEWEKVGFQWILFYGVRNGITIKGNGVIDGRGESWWTAKDLDGPTHRPHAIKIARSFNVTVTGIQIKNSPKFHIFIVNTQYLRIFNFSTSSPDDSPNTDGIHISNVQHVKIHNSNLACGDDCVSIQTGCSDVRIYNVNCGPGHGYSIGGLGPNNTEAHVSDIAVFNSTVQDSLTGGGYGSVHDVRFSNITMTDVKTPITIDQNYCGGPKNCSYRNDTNAVAIRSVVYENITGTYTFRSVSLICSEYEPCRNLTVATIDIVPSEGSMGGDKEGGPCCENAYGRVLTNTTPPLQDCLLPEAVPLYVLGQRR
ncbi:Polygalacturonase [Sesamum alatum]|uniref:Polygalacturonase n=1 Tax=Sesamum alatum TaxID=300844 RepID=A0AAE2CD46_9LAMI|nr:Polygalacturonase [Sesamum alatum]